MEYTVPVLSIVFMAVSMVAAVAVPLCIVLYLKKKRNCSLLSFFIGIIVMFLFAFLLEKLVHSLVLASPFGAVISGNIWIYGLYGGLMAGLFEEGGRFIAFKTVLDKHRGNDYNALMYGAGHGGFEMFYILFFTMLSNLTYSVMLNGGNTDSITAGLSGDSLTYIQGIFAQLSQSSPSLFLVSLVERLAAICAQLALSVVVWFAAVRGGRLVWLFPAAILLHAALDMTAAVASKFISNLAAVEGLVWIMSLLCVFIAYRVWKTCRKNAPQSE